MSKSPSVRTTPETPLTLNQDKQKPSLCKVSSVALGVILIIGGSVAAGMLYFYAQLGNFSFISLAAIPFGIASIVAGIRFGSSEPIVKSETPTQPPPSNEPDMQPTNTQNPEPTVGSQEWVDKTYPLKSNNPAEVKRNLGSLGETELSQFGHLLKNERIIQLNPKQLNWLPWKRMLEPVNGTRDVTTLLYNLFPVEGETISPEHTQILQQLQEDVLKEIYHLLTPIHISALSDRQFSQLPWDVIASDSAILHYKPMLVKLKDRRLNMLRYSKHWDKIAPHLTLASGQPKGSSKRQTPVTPPLEPKKEPEPPKTAASVVTPEPKKEITAPAKPLSDPPKPAASTAKVEPTKQPESPPIGTQEWVNQTYPLRSENPQEVRAKLQALGKDELSSFGHLLGWTRLGKLKPEQFNWLPWAALLKTNRRDVQALLRNTFEGIGTSTSNLPAFHALEQPVIEHIWSLLGSNQLAALSGIQCTWLPWGTMEESDIKYYLGVMYPEDAFSTKNKILFLKDTSHWNTVNPHLGQKRLELLK